MLPVHSGFFADVLLLQNYLQHPLQVQVQGIWIIYKGVQIKDGAIVSFIFVI